LSLLAPVAALFRERGVAMAIIGAAAMAAHGVSRATRDVDILTVDVRCLAPAFWDGLRAEGAMADVRVGDATDPLAGVVRLRRKDGLPLDVVVGRGAWQGDVVRRAGESVVDGVAVPVVRVADLILLKLYAGGPQDSWDIAMLLAAPDRPAIVAEVERALAALPEDARRRWPPLRDAR
jgi:hypothetical protein